MRPAVGHVPARRSGARCKNSPVADAIFEDRRLAELYDPLHPERSDLSAYLALVNELDARSVLDIGCGTGTFACLLAQRGIDVIGLDPAAASVDVGRTKPFADEVKWHVGDVSSLPAVQVDLVTMTGNVAQVFVGDEEWASTLRAAHLALRSGGHLVFEVRDPDREAWMEWVPEESYERLVLPTIGPIETWLDLLQVDLPLVSFRWTFVFGDDGTEITSESMLRFRRESEIVEELQASGFAVADIRDAPDRPGRELVFVAQKIE
jgi:SAM-dependent methyltransferase